MNRYGRVGMEAKMNTPQTDSCHRTKKQIKDSIASVEDDLALLQEVLTRDISDYSSTTEAIGRSYVRLVYLKSELKEYKKQGKK